MADKKRVKGFSANGVVHEKEKDFDQDYITISIVDKVTKIGEGEHDFIIEKEVIEERKPIQEVIDVDKESVGVYNIIKMVMRTGDTSLLPADDGKCNVDFVGAPETLMEVQQLGDQAAAAFGQLPEELTKGMDMTSFVNSLTQEQFDAFIKAVADRSSGNNGEKKDE